jgi:DNA repair exonuclease SbcCD ATPase subunit
VCNQVASAYKVQEDAKRLAREQGFQKKQAYIAHGVKTRAEIEAKIKQVSARLEYLESEVLRLEPLRASAEEAVSQMARVSEKGSAEQCRSKLSHTKHYLLEFKEKLTDIDNRIGELDGDRGFEELKQKITDLHHAWDSLDTESFLSLPLLSDTDVSANDTFYQSESASEENSQVWTSMMAELFDNCARPMFSFAKNLVRGRIAVTDADSAQSGIPFEN